jgi:hypothetical protein
MFSPLSAIIQTNFQGALKASPFEGVPVRVGFPFGFYQEAGEANPAM